MTDCWHCAGWAKNLATSRYGLCSECDASVTNKVYKSLKMLSTHVEIAESDKAAVNTRARHGELALPIIRFLKQYEENGVKIDAFSAPEIEKHVRGLLKELESIRRDRRHPDFKNTDSKQMVRESTSHYPAEFERIREIGFPVEENDSLIRVTISYGRAEPEPVGFNYSQEDLERCSNSWILVWWTDELDELIRKEAETNPCYWPWYAAERILQSTDAAVIKEWLRNDTERYCSSAQDELTLFIESRAKVKGYVSLVRPAMRRECKMCEYMFNPDSLQHSLIRRIGLHRLEYCGHCLRGCVYQYTGGNHHTEDEVVRFFQNLAATIEIIPKQDYGESVDDLRHLDDETLFRVLSILKGKPSSAHIRSLFGSWLKALVASGVLDGDVRRTSRGTQCVALDGHDCLSLGEKTIDDFLDANGVHHEKEWGYPEGNYRADFYVDGVFIEYFGLKGNPDYDKKTRLKQRLCKKHKIELISVYPSDLVSAKKLRNKLGRLIANEASRSD